MPSPLDALTVTRPRRPLDRTRSALASGRLRIGVIGGSISAPEGNTWPEGMISWFRENSPGVRIEVENVAIGATESDLAVLRVHRDLLARQCDLVFVDYAVNDDDTEPSRRRRTQEGLLRLLLADSDRDVVLVYPFAPPFLDDMLAGRVPSSIADFEQLAEHYELPSVWIGLHALRENRAGILRWEEWLPDGLHPTERGSWSYASAVRSFLDAELVDAVRPSPGARSLPPALAHDNWESATVLPLTDITLEGPWTLRRNTRWWSDQLLETAALGARLTIDFSGTGVMLCFDFGRASSEFRYRVDGGDWARSTRSRPPWCGESGWLRLFPAAEGLAPGAHRLEVEVVHGGPECTGTNFRLAIVGIVA